MLIRAQLSCLMRVMRYSVFALNHPLGLKKRLILEKRYKFTKEKISKVPLNRAARYTFKRLSRYLRDLLINVTGKKMMSERKRRLISIMSLIGLSVYLMRIKHPLVQHIMVYFDRDIQDVVYKMLTCKRSRLTSTSVKWDEDLILHQFVFEQAKPYVCN